MPIFYMICGIPASGKSTVAQEIASTENAVVLSSDEIRRELYKRKMYNRNQNEETFKLLRSRLTETFSSGKNIVIDAINRRKSERKQYAERAKKKGYYTICVYCKKDSGYALYANRMRNGAKRVPDKVVLKNHQLFVPPDESEGWDEIRINDGNKYSIEVEHQKSKHDIKN